MTEETTTAPVKKKRGRPRKNVAAEEAAEEAQARIDEQVEAGRTFDRQLKDPAEQGFSLRLVEGNYPTVDKDPVAQRPTDPDAPYMGKRVPISYKCPEGWQMAYEDGTQMGILEPVPPPGFDVAARSRLLKRVADAFEKIQRPTEVHPEGRVAKFLLVTPEWRQLIQHQQRWGRDHAEIRVVRDPAYLDQGAANFRIVCEDEIA